MKPTDKVKVNGKEYLVQTTLGDGAFAFVYKCKAPDGSLVACKVMQLQDETQALEAEAEASLFRSISFHPNIVKFLDSESRRGRLTEVVIVQELLGESLFTMMQQKSARPKDFFEDSFVLVVVSQVASALSHLHHLDLFHRDVKPENILLAGKSPKVVVLFESFKEYLLICEFGSFFGSCATLGLLVAEPLFRQAKSSEQSWSKRLKRKLL
jgi:serine/threonine protein kinase